LIIVGGYLGYLQRVGIIDDIKKGKKYFLLVEALFLFFFIFGLLIKFGNPDLWHPWKGGEKPMDFSYFNAILKSTSFPPYDPWFAGGYINYYYYGFMLVGVLVKFLGITPSIAYNLILPTLLAMIALGAFSIVWNLLSGEHNKKFSIANPIFLNDIPTSAEEDRKPRISIKFIASLSGAALIAVLGNLGFLQMFAQGLQKVAAPEGNIDTGGAVSKIIWTVSGFFKSITGSPIPIRLDEWYWNPSRVIGFEHGNLSLNFLFSPSCMVIFMLILLRFQ